MDRFLLLLEEAIGLAASDLLLTDGRAPYYRAEGELMARGEALRAGFLMDVLAALLSPAQLKALQHDRALDFAFTRLGRRFRGSAYYQSDQAALALRLLPQGIPRLKDLGAAPALAKMLDQRAGLILVTGRAGSGKSTTLAAFLSELAERRALHIVTLEDPIEYIFTSGKSFFSQRELGRDFLSFPAALKDALRESPDVILVGEIRDAETMATALAAAEAGARVLGTLHTGRAADAPQRIEGLFTANEQERARAALSSALTAIFAQQLIAGANGGRVLLTETLLATPAVRSLIRQGKFSQLPGIMQSNAALGMETRERSLSRLLKSGKITAAAYQALLNEGTP